MKYVALLSGFCGFAPVVSAASALTGILTDPLGHLVPGANVSLLRRADSSRRETKSDDRGQYSFGAIDSGEYRPTVESSGFPIITRTIQVSDAGTQVEDVQFSAVASQN